MNRLKMLKVAVLILDHQAKMQVGDTYSAKSPYGNVYKFNLSRSVVQIRLRKPSTIELDHKKANLSELCPKPSLEVEFADDGRIVRYRRANSTGKPIARPGNKREAVRTALLAILEEARADEMMVSASDVASRIGITEEAAGLALKQLGAKPFRKASRRGWTVTRRLITGK